MAQHRKVKRVVIVPHTSSGGLCRLLRKTTQEVGIFGNFQKIKSLKNSVNILKIPNIAVILGSIRLGPT